MDLISENQKNAREAFYHSPFAYNNIITQFSPIVSELINNNKFSSVLEYGAHNTDLVTSLVLDHEITLRCFDPAITQFTRRPEPAQMLVCIDFIEKVEPNFLENTLKDIASLTEQLALFVIQCGPAQNEYSDGRDINLIQDPLSLWLNRILDHFELDHLLKLEDDRYLLLLFPKEDEKIDSASHSIAN